MTSSSEAFEQDCPLTRRLQQLLHQYDAGTTLQELVQNADDANATKVIFILDLRTHGTASLIAPAMKMMQGPALLQYDDAIFLPENFAAVRAHARVGLMLWSCIAWARCAAHARSHTHCALLRHRRLPHATPRALLVRLPLSLTLTPLLPLRRARSRHFRRSSALAMGASASTQRARDGLASALTRPTTSPIRRSS